MPPAAIAIFRIAISTLVAFIVWWLIKPKNISTSFRYAWNLASYAIALVLWFSVPIYMRDYEISRLPGIIGIMVLVGGLAFIIGLIIGKFKFDKTKEDFED